MDPDELDTTFENCVKLITQVTRYFKEKDLPKISLIATSIKTRIDDFKPVVPVALALRKKGMVDRHWDAISK